MLVEPLATSRILRRFYERLSDRQYGLWTVVPPRGPDYSGEIRLYSIKQDNLKPFLRGLEQGEAIINMTCFAPAVSPHVTPEEIEELLVMARRMHEGFIKELKFELEREPDKTRSDEATGRSHD
jgi:hypothetical protein